MLFGPQLDQSASSRSYFAKEVVRPHPLLEGLVKSPSSEIALSLPPQEPPAPHALRVVFAPPPLSTVQSVLSLHRFEQPFSLPERAGRVIDRTSTLVLLAHFRRPFAQGSRCQVEVCRLTLACLASLSNYPCRDSRLRGLLCQSSLLARRFLPPQMPPCFVSRQIL